MLSSARRCPATERFCTTKRAPLLHPWKAFFNTPCDQVFAPGTRTSVAEGLRTYASINTYTVHKTGATSYNNGYGSQSSSQSISTPTQKLAKVRFALKFHASYGQTVKVVGSHPQLGAWKLEKAPTLYWTPEDVWVCNVQLPVGDVVEYKYVLVQYDTDTVLEWQAGSNAVIAIEDNEATLEVQDNWGNAPGAMVVTSNGNTTREGKLQNWAKSMSKYKLDAQQAREQLARKTEEVNMLKAELAHTKMELGLAMSTQTDMDKQVEGLQEELSVLRSQLAQSQMAMQETLQEAVRLLRIDEDDEEVPSQPSQPASQPASRSYDAYSVYESRSFDTKSFWP